MKLLSLKIDRHDCNICYFDGQAVHYHKTERTYNIKHHAYQNYTDWIADVKLLWNVDVTEIDEIAVVDNSIPMHSLFTEYSLPGIKCKVWKVDHHYCHALSYWPVSEKQPDIHFVIDGMGDERVLSVFRGDILLKTIYMDKETYNRNDWQLLDNSIGHFMCRIGGWLGIDSNPDLDTAGKVMGLQSYGQIDNGYLTKIRQYGIESVNEIISLENWHLYKGSQLVANLTPLDYISTVHKRLGEVICELFLDYVKVDDIIHYSGGVALNVVWNSSIKQYFPNTIITPHCADDGLSLGAMEWLRRKNNLPKFKIENYPYIQSDEKPTTVPSNQTIKKVAKLLSEGKIIGWYQGNGEIGQRALGNRSILMSPLVENGKWKINQIKRREDFRPFGASVLKEQANNYFSGHSDEYMLFTSKIENKMPAITHIDGTCRVQLVDKKNSYFYQLLTEFYNNTGCPILLNTSLNLAGKPIAGTIKEAKQLLYETTIDVIIVGDEIFEKEK